jgi:hypothetical protein
LKVTAAEVLEGAAEYIERHGFAPVGHNGPEWDIFSWNDAPERTAEEVCRVLREVAASLTDQPSPAKVEDPALEQLGEELIPVG